MCNSCMCNLLIHPALKDITMKHIFSLFLATLLCCTAAFSQDDDWYRPGGFDANGGSLRLFSVSDSKKVHFSRGNLQYNATQNKWRFALRQYNSICTDNNNVAQDYDGWIDLFGWGTSGWNSGANAYQPWSTGYSTDDYAPGGDITNGLIGEYANADWGVYNKITNGGNKAEQWRTLTAEEWTYLIGNSSARQNKWALATIGGIYRGMVILPDEWSLRDGLSFTPRYPNIYMTNVYSFNEWQRMEASGAVFLPAAGSRSNVTTGDVNKFGIYWASTAQNATTASCIYFTTGTVYVGQSNPYVGRSVRLVRDYEPSGSLGFDHEGASLKRFSVADGRTVRFSKGNLRYNAATNTWAFASKQYLYIGSANTNASESYDGWIDLFSWGTSGWSESGATAYQPWSTSQTGNDYYVGGSESNNLTGNYAKADWGVYNNITNGGNKAGQWRTLTSAEWKYLLSSSTYNTARYGKFALATIDSRYKGLVILPDDWTLPSGIPFTAGTGNGYNTNTYNTLQWKKMEAAGAIFLPAAGRRKGTQLLAVDDEGDYWSTTYDSGNTLTIFFSEEEGVLSEDGLLRYMSAAVRLVKD